MFASGRPHYPKRKGDYSVKEGDVYRHADYPEFHVAPFPGCHTVYDVFEYAVDKNGNRNALGTRELIQTTEVVDPKDPAGRMVEKLVLGAYKWITFREAHRVVTNIGSGLVNITGLQPKDKVIIYADTKAEWQLTAQALFRQNATVVTIYATLGPEGVEHGAFLSPTLFLAVVFFYMYMYISTQRTVARVSTTVMRLFRSHLSHAIFDRDPSCAKIASHPIHDLPALRQDRYFFF